jgi:hypothetical protein
MRRRHGALVLAGAAAALALVTTTAGPAAAAAGAPPARAATSCRALATPASLGATLLAQHRAYMRHQPDVHKPKITGPVGRVYLGVCGSERYALAVFDATYNGLYFGPTDQPERFVEPAGGGWRDIGNTGGEPCGSAPTALLEAWKIVRSCPG